MPLVRPAFFRGSILNGNNNPNNGSGNNNLEGVLPVIVADAEGAPEIITLEDDSTGESPFLLDIVNTDNGITLDTNAPVTGDLDFEPGDTMLVYPSMVTLPVEDVFNQPNGMPLSTTVVIVPGVVELQRNSSRGLFNRIQETQAQSGGGSSPLGLEFRNNTVTGFTTFAQAYDGGIGDNILDPAYQGAQVRVTATGEIFDVAFNAWQSGGGGGFSMSVFRPGTPQPTWNFQRLTDLIDTFGQGDVLTPFVGTQPGGVAGNRNATVTEQVVGTQTTGQPGSDWSLTLLSSFTQRTHPVGSSANLRFDEENIIDVITLQSLSDVSGTYVVNIQVRTDIDNPTGFVDLGNFQGTNGQDLSIPVPFANRRVRDVRIEVVPGGTAAGFRARRTNFAENMLVFDLNSVNTDDNSVDVVNDNPTYRTMVLGAFESEIIPPSKARSFSRHGSVWYGSLSGTNALEIDDLQRQIDDLREQIDQLS